MDLFQSVEKTYTAPKATKSIVDWMIADAMRAGDRCFDILRRHGASDAYIEGLIRRRWDGGRCRTGHWGAYSGRAQRGEVLVFGWGVHISTRDFFNEREGEIRGRAVIDAVRRVAAIPVVDEQHDLTYIPTSTPVQRLHDISYRSRVHGLPPMSMRAQYQRGAVNLYWLNHPARSVPPVCLSSLESWGIGRMIRRALNTVDATEMQNGK